MLNGSKEVSWKDFMSNAAARFAPWDEAKVRAILRENFVNFEPDQHAQYTACLQKAWEREAAESREKVRMDAERASRERAAEYAATPEEQERRRLLAEEQYGPEYCPTCGVKTIPALGWWSAIYGVAGWKCDGKLDHFIKWARERRKDAQQPISN